ncbi:MAG: type II secretion system F family protein [Clostridiales bacterium]|nr:type II secretion system F family protein [Clostridiales bacterium]
MDGIIAKLGRARDIIMHDKGIAGKIYLITVAAALLILVLVIKGPEERGTFIIDDRGNAVAVRRHSLEHSEDYDVRVRIGSGEEADVRDISFTIDAVSPSNGSGGKQGSGENHEAEISAELDRIITGIELSDEMEIPLPGRLTDGTRLTWRAKDKQDMSNIVLIPVMYIVLIGLLIHSSLTAPATESARVRKEIMKGLPRFCNQLFLMMNAGMILSDAFDRICSCYREYGEGNMTWFEKALTELSDQNADKRESTASMINEFAVRYNVKEMIRISTILTENEKRGSDVIESLSRESRYLWDDRRIVARESSRMIDTRMSWPLGLLLILLIVITMAPAMLSM